MKYDKSETGWILIVLFTPILIFITLLYINQWGDRPITLIPYIIICALFVLVVSLFYKLTIKVNDKAIHLIYGIGIIKFSIYPDQISKIEIIRTPWYYGLGIRLTPKGRLYNIQSFKAIKLDYLVNHSHKRVMIGTPEPEVLKKILEENFPVVSRSG